MYTRSCIWAFHSTQNSWNFGWYIKWNRPFRFGPTRIFETRFEGSPLWPVRSFLSVGPKCPFPLDKIVFPSTALLYPAYKNNNQTRAGLIGSLQPECTVPLGTWNFRNFKPEFLLNGKRPWFQFKTEAGSVLQIKNKNFSHFYCSMFVFNSRICMT